MKKKKLYEIGDTWEAKAINGRIGKILLQELYYVRRRRYEVWRWFVVWDDGSGFKTEIESSYRKCVENIPIYNGLGNKPVRFKKINNPKIINKKS